MSPCMGISDEIDDAAIAIYETTMLDIKATIWPFDPIFSEIIV